MYLYVYIYSKILLKIYTITVILIASKTGIWVAREKFSLFTCWYLKFWTMYLHHLLKNYFKKKIMDNSIYVLYYYNLFLEKISKKWLTRVTLWLEVFLVTYLYCIEMSAEIICPNTFFFIKFFYLKKRFSPVVTMGAVR